MGHLYHGYVSQNQRVDLSHGHTFVESVLHQRHTEFRTTEPVDLSVYPVGTCDAFHGDFIQK